MPSNLQFADSAFPNLTAEQSQEEKTRVILNYLYMLLEQLRYSFNNLGVQNFNETELAALSGLITEPVYLQLSDLAGNMTSLAVEAGILASRISDAEGNISTLTQTAQGFNTRVSNAEGNISSLSQTATTLSSRITNAEGAVSAISQTVDTIYLSVVNSETYSQIVLTKNGVAVSAPVIQMTGLVTFSALGSSGMTTINGDNIVSGTITGTTLISREYATNPSWLVPRRTVAIQEGHISFGYDQGSDNPQNVGTTYGEIYTDYANNRFFIGTPGGKVLKIYSGGNMSIDAENNYTIYIGTQAGTNQAINIGRSGSSVIHLDGVVYVNNTLIS